MRSPWRSRIAAIMRVVEVFPLVPTTCTVRKRRCGEPSTVIMRRIRSRPKRIPNSSSERRWRSARSPLQGRSGILGCLPPPVAAGFAARLSWHATSSSRRAVPRSSASPRGLTAPPARRAGARAWSRSPSTTSAGARCTKPALASLPCTRAISPSSFARDGRAASLGRREIEPLAGEHLDACRRHRDRGHRLGGGSPASGADRDRDERCARIAAVDSYPSASMRAATSMPGGAFDAVAPAPASSVTASIARSSSISASRVDQRLPRPRG